MKKVGVVKSLFPLNICWGVSFSPGRDRIRRHDWISLFGTPWEKGRYVWKVHPSSHCCYAATFLESPIFCGPLFCGPSFVDSFLITQRYFENVDPSFVDPSFVDPSFMDLLLSAPPPLSWTPLWIPPLLYFRYESFFRKEKQRFLLQNDNLNY